MSGFHAWTDEGGTTHVTIEANGQTYTMSGPADVQLDYKRDLAEMEPVGNWRTYTPGMPEFDLTFKLSTRTMTRETT